MTENEENFIKELTALSKKYRVIVSAEGTLWATEDDGKWGTMFGESSGYAFGSMGNLDWEIDNPVEGNK